MRLAFILLAAALLCSFARPPAEFRTCLANVPTTWTDRAGAAFLCELAGAGADAMGCADERRMILIHPTRWSMAWGDYAGYLEHELGHVCGWRHD